VPHPYIASFRQIQAALLAQAHAMESVRTRMERMSERAKAVQRMLDDCDIRLHQATRRLNSTVDLLDDAVAKGPRASLDKVIDQLEQDCLDGSNSRLVPKYQDLLTRARAVRSNIREN